MSPVKLTVWCQISNMFTGLLLLLSMYVESFGSFILQVFWLVGVCLYVFMCLGILLCCLRMVLMSMHWLLIVQILFFWIYPYLC